MVLQPGIRAITKSTLPVYHKTDQIQIVTQYMLGWQISRYLKIYSWNER